MLQEIEEIPLNDISPLTGYKTLNLSLVKKLQWHKEHNNTFGTMWGPPSQGGTCPGATTGKGGCCETKGKRQTCYMAKTTQIYKQVGARLKFNSDLMVGKPFAEIVEVYRNTILKFLLDNKGKDQYFRNFYSGDVANMDVAKALTKVMREFKYVKFWQYTRSFFAVPTLLEASNLSLYLSCDPCNFDEAKKLYEELSPKYPNLGMAWMGNTPSDEYKWVSCPSIKGVKLKTGEEVHCSKCKLCMTCSSKVKQRLIHFPIH